MNIACDAKILLLQCHGAANTAVTCSDELPQCTIRYREEGWPCSSARASLMEFPSRKNKRQIRIPSSSRNLTPVQEYVSHANDITVLWVTQYYNYLLLLLVGLLLYSACRRLSLHTPSVYSRTSTNSSNAFVPNSPEHEKRYWGPGETLPHNLTYTPSLTTISTFSRRKLTYGVYCKDCKALLKVILKDNY